MQCCKQNHPIYHMPTNGTHHKGGNGNHGKTSVVQLLRLQVILLLGVCSGQTDMSQQVKNVTGTLMQHYKPLMTLELGQCTHFVKHCQHNLLHVMYFANPTWKYCILEKSFFQVD